MKKQIAVLPGDGVGPEVTAQAVKVLKKIAQEYHHEFTFTEGLIGAVAIEKAGDPLPDETLELCKNADAILFGAIGHPKYDNNPSLKVRPEQGLLKLRKELGLYANIRPIMTFPNVKSSPLKDEVIKNVDFVVVRELTGGIYFGDKGRKENSAFDVCTYTKEEIERVAKLAFKLAQERSRLRKASASQGKLTLIDKANVLETSRLWRETIQEQSKQFSNVTIEYMFVDNAALQIIKRPSSFDVILTDNMFGDILTDEASVIAGSIGLLPSASKGEKTSLFEPIHGSFPKASGTNTANPIGSILSAAMLLDMSLQLAKESKAIRKAVFAVLEKGYGTKDITTNSPLQTHTIGDKITALI
ncbi:MAG: 3-isopropylmalate dehydrogenase [Candidatus Levybacteria bacterium]|nr:3-isopropylmalate dehydrogenase [Candidatus Levybacteria bacterium]